VQRRCRSRTDSGGEELEEQTAHHRQNAAAMACLPACPPAAGVGLGRRHSGALDSRPDASVVSHQSVVRIWASARLGWGLHKHQQAGDARLARVRQSGRHSQAAHGAVAPRVGGLGLGCPRRDCGSSAAVSERSRLQKARWRPMSCVRCVAYHLPVLPANSPSWDMASLIAARAPQSAYAPPAQWVASLCDAALEACNARRSQLVSVARLRQRILPSRSTNVTRCPAS
jgi:hypothetical protein